MNRWRRKACVCVLALSLLLTACGRREKRVEFEPGETVETYWFRFTVDSAQETDQWQGRQAEENFRLVVCGLTIQSTFESAVSMGRGDFVLQWETGEEPEEDASAEEPWAGMEGVYPLPEYTDGQLPDEYELEAGERVEGQLVFQVPDEVTRAALMFEEYFADSTDESGYTVGDHYLVWLDLSGASQGESDPS